MINRLIVNRLRKGIKMSNVNERSGEAIRLFIQTDRLHKSLFDGVMNTVGLHRSQHWALLYLHRQGAIDSQKKIADHLGISPAAVAVMMKRLETLGYVRRQISSSDSRNHIIVLTEAGEEILRRTRRFFSDIDRRMLKGLSDNELDVFIACHQKIQENLQAMRLDGGNIE